MFCVNRIHASSPIVRLLALVTVAVGPVAAGAVDLDDLTVVTLARDGSWGVARAASQGAAIAGAIRDCRAMAGGPSDCGAQFATTRGGWVVAKLCGDHKIIVSAATRQAADQAARVRAVALNRLHVCKRVLTVGPNGVVLPAQAETDEQGATGADPDQAQSATGRFVPRFDIGALTAESDFTLFMRKEVPDDVRLLTLRRLWVLMRLPVSCHELYFERERAESDLSQLTGEKLIAAAE